MFEEICLVCGRQVDDGRAYCSDVCQNQDTTSPSISSASSPFSSPHIEYAVGGDVPALVPSALGSLLNRPRRTNYSVSSSSASSTSWSLVTDEDEGDTMLNAESDWHHDVSDPVYESISKLSAHLSPMRTSGLSYARRPSGTNNHSTIPLLHRRTSSGSSPGHVHGAPRSAPIASYAIPGHITAGEDGDDEACSSDLEFTSTHHRHHHQSRQSEGHKSIDKGSTITGRVKRTRNRASLPACFSLLAVTGSSKSQNTLPLSTSGTTGPQLSPSTPKLTLAALPHSLGIMQATPRGRRPEAVSVREGLESRSQSPPPPPPPHPKLRHAEIRQRFQKAFNDDDDDAAPSAPAPRGRATVRRNSSPPQKMMDLSGNGFRLGSESRTRTRGRLRAGELEGVGCSELAPGLGSGRSGILSRERERERRERGRSGLGGGIGMS